jgi:hypothetical protein
LDRKSSETSGEVNMAFISRKFLEEKSSSGLRKYASRFKYSLSIFLSHSHKDKDLVIGFKSILQYYYADIYIDWEDGTLPDEPNKETAKRIKERIKESDLFILLATDNALSSTWCSWEIGIADGIKGYEYILIVPVTDDSGNFRGNEYLQIYKRIEIVQLPYLEIFVLEPSLRKYGETLSKDEIESQVETLEDFLKRNTKTSW